MIIVLVGIFMATIVVPFVEGIRNTRLPEVVTTANFLAVEKTEELAATAYASLSDEARAAVSGFTDYEREVDETEVDGTDLSTPSPGSGYRTITVTTYHSELPAAGISIVTLRTNY